MPAVCAWHGDDLRGDLPACNPAAAGLQAGSHPTTYQEEGLAKDKGVVVRRGLKPCFAKAMQGL